MSLHEMQVRILRLAETEGWSDAELIRNLVIVISSWAGATISNERAVGSLESLARAKALGNDVRPN